MSVGVDVSVSVGVIVVECGCECGVSVGVSVVECECGCECGVSVGGWRQDGWSQRASIKECRRVGEMYLNLGVAGWDGISISG